MFDPVSFWIKSSCINEFEKNCYVEYDLHSNTNQGTGHAFSFIYMYSVLLYIVIYLFSLYRFKYL